MVPGPDRGRGCGDVAGAGSVDRAGLQLVVLGRIDVRPGGAVDHRVGLRLRQRDRDRAGVGDVQLRVSERGRLVARCPRRLADVAAEHPAGSRDEDPHRAKPSGPSR